MLSRRLAPPCILAEIRPVTFLFLALVSAAIPASAQKAHAPAAAAVTPAGTLTPEMVVSMRSIRDLAVSPDGQWIAYTLQVPRGLDEDRGSAYLEIWLMDRDGKHPRQFTPSKQRSWSPAFSPDGKRLAFLANRPGRDSDGDKDDADKAGIFLIDLQGGEARQLTAGEYSVRSCRWSPTGEALAFTAKAPMPAERKEARKKGRDWIEGDVDLTSTPLWSVRVADGKVVRLTTTDANVLDFDWSPNGTSLVVRLTDSARVDESYLTSRLTLVPATGGEPAPLVRTQGKLDQPHFSPDGKHVAWLGATSVNDPFPGTVYVVPATGGTARALTTAEPGCATALEWTDASTLLYAASRGTATALVTVPAAGGKLRDVLTNGPIFSGFALSSNRKTLALVGNTPRHPGEIFAAAYSSGGTRVRRLTTTNLEVERTQLGAQKVMRWKATDGLDIEGVLVHPVGYTPGARYPLVVMAHGGPESCFRNGWNTSYSQWAQLLAQRGYVVLMPNYRGSTGRGEAFERGDHGDLAGKEFEDVLAGIDALAAAGTVDPARVGIGGGSYGGYFSAWAATAWSERFAASVDFAGITDWHSMQGVSDIPLENATVHWNLPYYENADLYWERSPLAHVQKCRTPILIAHGDSDRRVPVGQAVELYTALRLLGREVELVRYPRAGHGLEESPHQHDFLTRVLDWYEQHLKEAPEAAFR